MYDHRIDPYDKYFGPLIADLMSTGWSVRLSRDPDSNIIVISTDASENTVRLCLTMYEL